MIASRATGALAALPVLVLAACTGDALDPADPQSAGGASIDESSLEQDLHLVPQLLRATDIPAAGKLLFGTIPSYLILDSQSGDIDATTLVIEDAQGARRALTELFAIPEATRAELLARDALLLTAVPAKHVAALCDRFQFAHEDIDIVKAQEQELLFQAPATDGLVHALCLLPPSVGPSSKGQGAGEPGTSNYGSGSYTVRIKTLKCNDPRDWENWPYNGDEARMRGFYNGMGGSQLWSANDVESGDSFTINRYIHFNSTGSTPYAKIELFDYDSAPWNDSDKLGSSLIYSDAACLGDRRADFDGSGGGHDWNYDMVYRVYGPNCPCQSQEPTVYQSYPSETCSVTSTTITSYSYYCSGGIYWRQAWGNRTRHCNEYNNVYNDSCEMHTYVSSTLISSCDHYEYGVALGSPTQYGTCSTDYCGDGICNGLETSSTCPSDCSSCVVLPCQQCLTLECPIP